MLNFLEKWARLCTDGMLYAMETTLWLMEWTVAIVIGVPALIVMSPILVPFGLLAQFKARREAQAAPSGVDDKSRSL